MDTYSIFSVVQTIAMYDCEGVNFESLPNGQAAGYVTGSDGVPWSAQQFAARPGTVRIDQSPASGPWDSTADIQDYEPLAVTLSEVPIRVSLMHRAYVTGLRPGQRSPAVYVGAQPNATPVVNELIASGISGGVGLAIAAPDMSDADAIALIQSTSNTPWPVIWVQNKFLGTYDAGHVSSSWLAAVSVAPSPKKLAYVDLHFTDGTTMEYT